jgi:hypothetical protein
VTIMGLVLGEPAIQTAVPVASVFADGSQLAFAHFGPKPLYSTAENDGSKATKPIASEGETPEHLSLFGLRSKVFPLRRATANALVAEMYSIHRIVDYGGMRASDRARRLPTASAQVERMNAPLRQRIQREISSCTDQ